MNSIDAFQKQCGSLGLYISLIITIFLTYTNDVLFTFKGAAFILLSSFIISPVIIGGLYYLLIKFLSSMINKFEISPNVMKIGKYFVLFITTIIAFEFLAYIFTFVFK